MNHLRSDGRARRNGGRTLVWVCESQDNGSLSLLIGLSGLTRSFVRDLGRAVDGWPSDIEDLFYSDQQPAAVRRWTIRDDLGDQQLFCFVPFDDYDIVFAVASRIAVNARGTRTENVATNELLDLLGTPTRDGSRQPLYGEIVANTSARLWRTLPGGMTVMEHCKAWDVTVKCTDLHWDPSVPNSDGSVIDSVRNAAREAHHIVLNMTRHRQEAHEQGVLKYARTNTTPLIAIHPETKVMRYDPVVCEAVRTAVRQLRSGDDFHAAAAHVAHLIPSYLYRTLPDTGRSGNGKRLGNRANLNERRALLGLPPLPFKYLDEVGTPNPAYVPETFADFEKPGDSIRRLIVGGITRPKGVQPTEWNRIVAEDLGGLPPADVTLEFLRTGIYRRLVKDPILSNQHEKKWRYVERDFGPFDVDEDGNPQYVLTNDDVEFVKAFRTGRGIGRQGQRALCQIFTPRQDGELWDRAGLLTFAGDRMTITDPDGTTVSGWLKFTTGTRIGRADRGCYRLSFERPGLRRNHAIATVDAAVLEKQITKHILDALTLAGADATVVDASAVAADGVAAAVDRLEAAKAAHARAAERYLRAQDDVDELTLEALTEAMKRQADDVAAAQAAVAAADNAHGAAVRRQDSAPLDHFLDLMALLGRGQSVEPDLARELQIRLRRYLKDAWMRATPGQMVEWGLVVELPTLAGATVRIPVTGALRNENQDPWLGGVLGVLWNEHVPLRKLRPQHRWDQGYDRKRLTARFLFEAARNNVTVRGEAAAWALLRSPYEVVLDIGLAIVAGGRTDGWPRELVESIERAFFVDAEDFAPRAFSWTDDGRNECDVVAVARAYVEASPPKRRKPVEVRMSFKSGEVRTLE